MDHFDNHEDHNQDNWSTEEPAVESHEGDHSPEEERSSEASSHSVSDDELQALWLEAAQDAPTTDDLELAKMEIQEAEELLQAQTREYKLGLLKRARVFGRGTVADEMEISRKALATWEVELQPEGDDLSHYYEQLKKNQEREARRAQRAAERAAQETAAIERLLERVRNR